MKIKTGEVIDKFYLLFEKYFKIEVKLFLIYKSD